jgi:adenylyltransferase/sulfurtransferase
VYCLGGRRIRRLAVLTQDSESFEDLPGIDIESQKRLRQGSVLIAGIGSSGAVAAEHLVSSGLGNLTLVDEDPKALSTLFKRLSDLPDCKTKIGCLAWKMDATEVEKIFSQFDVIIDGLSNWQEKLLAGDICMHIRKPLVHAGGNGFRYQLYTMYPSRSACLRCAFPRAGIDDIPLSTQEIRSIGPVLAMVGAWQALEAIKLIARIGAIQGNELIKFDWLSGEFETIRGLDPSPDCPDCGRVARL